MFPTGQGAQDLKNQAKDSDHLIVLPLDVTSQDSVDQLLLAVEEDLRETDHQLWALINNAGVGRTGCVEWGDLDYHFRDAIEVNLIGTVRMTRKFLPLLRSSRGRLILMGSLTSEVSLPFTTAYGMTKKAIQVFAEGLRFDLEKHGVKVIAIEPSFSSTQLTSEENVIEIMARAYQSSSEEVKKAYQKDLPKCLSACHAAHSDFLMNPGHIRHLAVKGIVESVHIKRPLLRYAINPLSMNF